MDLQQSIIYVQSTTARRAPRPAVFAQTHFVGEGSEAALAGVNDSLVDCQSREWTEPQRDRPLQTRSKIVGEGFPLPRDSHNLCRAAKRMVRGGGFLGGICKLHKF